MLFRVHPRSSTGIILLYMFIQKKGVDITAHQRITNNAKVVPGKASQGITSSLLLAARISLSNSDNHQKDYILRKLP